MMFNGFLMYGDSDTSASDVTKSSNGPVSLSSDSPRDAHRDQLDATLQILKNKEETVRVQAESLALAEARIADLSRRLDALGPPDRAEPARTRDCSISCCASAADDDTSAQLTEGEVVGALRDNLAVVQRLYRESFYEMARQGEAMDALRRANVQLRARERRHAARYRELAAEVERLKCDVNEVIGSNSDSGVWGAGTADGDTAASIASKDSGVTRDNRKLTRDSGDAGQMTRECDDARDMAHDSGDAGEVTSGLRHVAGQLRRLRDMLACECTCGLAEENKKLKLANDSLEREVSELRERVRQLEQSLRDKDGVLYKSEQPGGGKETHDSTATLSSQLQLLHGVLNEKSSRLQSAEGKTQRLRERLKKMDSVVKKNVAVREELSQLSLQVERLRRAGEGAGRQHASARRFKDELLPEQTSYIDLRREACALDGPCARVQAGRHDRDEERRTRVRAGRLLIEEPCSRCGSECAFAPPTSTKKKSMCDAQECWCDADCCCCAGGACEELRSSCDHDRRPSGHGHRSASETLKRVAATREAVPGARQRWLRRATHS